MNILRLKKILYFPTAYYFKFFAQVQLKIWKPRIVVITGSNGKTTFLHLIESQLGDKAKYSHHANSTYGIPFNILGLERRTLNLIEWPLLFLLAPFKAFKAPSKQKIYVVEADCDRPDEGKFLATLLKPDVSIWLSSTRTHSTNFAAPLEENIAFEFGYFLEYTSELVIVNKDSLLIKKQLSRTKANIEQVSIGDLQTYQIFKNRTEFNIKDKIYKFNFLLPKETSYQIQAMIKILNYLNIPISSFKNFTLPPGRSSLLTGIKNTTILDSSYNADLESMKVMLKMFDAIPVKKKWLVLGDMVEQGQYEGEEHQRLVSQITSMRIDKILLIGPRLLKYTYPGLKDKAWVKHFILTLAALNYIKANIKGGEFIFFKGARFLEGVIEHLLRNKADINKLCRREQVWQKRRKKWGL